MVSETFSFRHLSCSGTTYCSTKGGDWQSAPETLRTGVFEGRIKTLAQGTTSSADEKAPQRD